MRIVEQRVHGGIGTHKTVNDGCQRTVQIKKTFRKGRRRRHHSSFPRTVNF